jgi:hypothetical protein
MAFSNFYFLINIFFQEKPAAMCGKVNEPCCSKACILFCYEIHKKKELLEKS